MAYKMALVVRQDLQLPKGKCASQCAHAAVEAVLRSEKKMVEAWRKEGMPKIVVKVKDLKELLALNQQAKDDGLVTAVITDAGRTTVEPGTTTCIGIGPDTEENVDRIIGKLKLL